MKLTDRINELAEFEVPYNIVRLQGGPYSINRELRGAVNLPGIHAEGRGILRREYSVVATGRLGFEMHDDQKFSTPKLPFSIGNIVGFEDGGIEVIDTQEGEKHHYPVHPGSYLFRLLVAEIGEQRVSEVIGSELTLGNFSAFFRGKDYKVRDIKARETSPLTAEEIELIKKEYPEGLFKGIHTEVHHIYDPNGLVYTFEMPSRRYRNKKEW